MKKNIAIIHTTLQKICTTYTGKLHLAHTLKSSFRGLLFLLAAGIFLFSCDEEVKLSSEATMTSLTLTVGSTDYEITFTNKQGIIKLPYATKLPVTAKVAAVQLSAKATGVKIGDDVTIPALGPLTLTVRAENKTTTQKYTVAVEKTDPRKEASITSLTLTVGTTDYEIDFTDRAYTLILPSSSTLPTAVGVKTIVLSAGATGAVQGTQLSVTNNTVTLTVTAEDGTTTQKYTVIVEKAAARSNASITDLTLTVGSTDYEIAFTDRAYTLILPAGSTLPARVGVKEIALSAGATSDAGTELSVTNNAVTITVTAEDKKTEQAYTVTLSVAASVGASITSLTLTVGSTDYEIMFEGTRGTVIVPYDTEIPAKVGVKKIALSDGATSDAGNELTVTDNAVTLTVTAADGETTSVYTVTLSVGANDEAGITSLQLSVAGSDYDVTFTDTQGSVIVSYGTVIPATVSVASVALSDGATGVVMGNDLTVTNNAVTLTVTAEDGETTQTYTVTLSVGANDKAGITTLQLSVSGSDYDVTFTDTQGSVIVSYGTVIPATVSVASVALSAGATGVVMGNDLTVTNNAVTLTVTAADGITTKTYTVTLSVAASVGASITSLTLTVGSTDYEIMFEGTRGTVIVPYDTEIPAKVGVKKIALSAGATSDAGNELTVTDNAVTLTVTAADGETTSVYTVTFSVGANDEAGITSLQLSVSGTSYDVTFTDTQGSVIVSYGTVIPATVSVASVALSAGATGVVMGNDLTVTNNAVTLTVTAEDGETTSVYTVTFSVGANDEAGITSLQLSVSGTSYDVTFTDTQGSVIVSYGTVIPATVSVASVALSAGATGVVMGDDLTVTNNAVTFTVTAVDGITTKTYTVTLSVGANDEAGITSLQLSVSGTSYDVTFTDTQGSVIVSYGTVIPATVGVTSVELSDGTTGVVMGDDLTVTNNAVTITVTAEDGETTQTYTVTFSVGANDEAGITSLQLSVAGSDYDVTFTDTQGNVIVPYGTVIPATVSVASVALSAGATGVVMGNDLTVTNNAVTFTVTAVDGITTQTYTVTLSVGANDEAGITSLKLSVAGSDYDVTFTDTQGNVIVPYGTAIPATVSVASVELSDGATGVVMGNDLTVTNNAVTLTVTAADGETTQTYTVTLSVGANDEAGITTLKLSVAGSDYDVTFTDTQGNVIVPYGTAIPATVGVASVALSDGATGVVMGDDLTVTNNAVTITVTAEDGTTEQEYTVTLSVATNDDASITDLTLMVAGTDYIVTFTDRQDTLRVGPYGTVIPATVIVTSVTLSNGATGVVQGSQRNVVEDKVTLTVTAADGTTTQEYTVMLGFTTAGIASFTFEVADNENMALDEDDRQQIVGMINHETKTITFAQQSAYVYLDKLKATFGLSEPGAGVQVGGADQTSGTTEQDFSAPVSYVVSAEGMETTTYTVTLLKSIMATIEDDQFRARLKVLVPAAFIGDQLDITHDDVVNNNGTLNVGNQTPKLTSLKGVEFFTALTALNCYSNSLTSLDMRKNTAVGYLSCFLNSLTSMDVRGLTALKDFDCNNNDLVSLDIRENTALTILKCYKNSLASLDVSANTALKTLDLDDNNLPSLDVRANTALTTLDCDRNSLSSLDVRANTALMNFSCGGNSLTSLDVSGATALTSLSCHTNSLTSLDVSANTALTRLYCMKNNLTSLDITGIRSATGLVLRLGTGTGTALEPDNHLLATLRVNTAIQDDENIVIIKTGRGANLTITTVNNDGDVVCNDYDPAETGGNCNQAP